MGGGWKSCERSLSDIAHIAGSCYFAFFEEDLVQRSFDSTKMLLISAEDGLETVRWR